MDKYSISAKELREEANKFSEEIYSWIAMDALQDIAVRQNELLLKVADYIEEFCK